MNTLEIIDKTRNDFADQYRQARDGIERAKFYAMVDALTIVRNKLPRLRCKKREGMHLVHSPEGKLYFHYNSDFAGTGMLVISDVGDVAVQVIDVDAREFLALAKQVVENDKLMNEDSE